MILIKFLFFLTILTAVLTSTNNDFEVFEIDDFQNSDLQLLDVKFLNYQEKYSEKLQELSKRLLRATHKEKIAIINEYIDDLIPALNTFIDRNDLEPIDIPGIEESFRWTIFIGWVLLDNGLMNGLSTFTRTGDVTVKYEYPDLKIRIPLGFSNLAFEYDYEVKFMYIGPTGKANGISRGNRFTIDLRVNLTTLRAKLDRFNLRTLGSVSLKFGGNILTDWIINLILIVVMPILKPILGLVLEGYIVDGLENVLVDYNNVVCTFLNDC